MRAVRRGSDGAGSVRQGIGVAHRTATATSSHEPSAFQTLAQEVTAVATSDAYLLLGKAVSHGCAALAASCRSVILHSFGQMPYDECVAECQCLVANL